MTLRHGYFTGAGYTFGAYSEPSPERLALLSLLRSHRPPDLAAPFRLLELGCGQGLQLCLQSANYPQAQCIGIDLQNDHIAHGRALAQACGLNNITFLQADVQQLDQAPPQVWSDLVGHCDIVVAHGVLSWVSPAIGALLLRLAAAALRPGGLLYVSYNALPGWLAATPFQHMVRTFQAHRGEGLPALEAARALFSALRDGGAQVFTAQPGLAPRLEGLAGMDPGYLLHEYNHSQWQPLYANQVIEPCRDLGLSFLGSAHLADNFDGILPEPYRRQLQEQSDSALREVVRDLLTNQAFRRDVYVKGLDPLWPREALARLEQLQVLRLQSEAELQEESAFQFRLGFGEIQGNRDWFLSLMQTLGDQPRSLADLRQALQGTPLPELLQNLALLIGRGSVALVPPDRDPGPARRCNTEIVSRVAAGAPYRALACPRSGNSHTLNDVELLGVQALLSGRSQEELVEAIDAGLQALERQIQRDGVPLGEEERRRELTAVVDRFRSHTVPLLQRLGVLQH
ncbi:MAG: methyltransferase regulatory domain-containing protein [Cyanobium sp.]